MTQLLINVGNVANDGQGTPLRTAFQYINSNFTELYNNVQATPPVSSSGQEGDVPGMIAFDQEYLYVCVDNNCLIKIKKYEEYDKICELIESGKNIFLIHENYKKYFISYGGYIESKLEQDDIKKTFFTNGKIYNKNYEILNKFKNVKIFLYVCTELLINQ